MTTDASLDVTTDWLLDPALAPDVEHDPIRPLYDAAARGELALPFCSSCDLALELEQHVCDGCGGATRTWRDVERRGVVHSSTMMHRREPGLIRTDDPYPIIDVEVSSGHRIVMTTAAPSSSAPPIGASVRIAFRTLGAVSIPAAQILEAHQ